jgi:exodeoxyribonuclease-3
MLIASWNVNSITVRLEAVLRWLASVQPDVLCLQETKIVDEKFPALAFEQAGYHCAFAGQPTYNGVAILSKGSMTDIQKHLPIEENKKSERFIQANINALTIINTYIPNGQAVGSDKFIYKLSFLEALKKYFSNKCNLSQPFIWCGDFNIAPEEIDVYDPVATDGQIMCSQTERDLLEEIKNLGFTDTFRQHNAGPGHFSWWDYRVGAFRRNLGFRIDHIWASASLANACTKAWIDKEPRKWERPSDHVPVLTQFNI